MPVLLLLLTSQLQLLQFLLEDVLTLSQRAAVVVTLTRLILLTTPVNESARCE